MTPFQEFRLWARRGPTSERVSAGMAAVVVVALLAWLLALVGTGSPSHVASGAVAARRAQTAAGSNPGAAQTSDAAAGQPVGVAAGAAGSVASGGGNATSGSGPTASAGGLTPASG